VPNLGASPHQCGCVPWFAAGSRPPSGEAGSPHNRRHSSRSKPPSWTGDVGFSASRAQQPEPARRHDPPRFGA
jgi:hypothetical protein